MVIAVDVTLYPKVLNWKSVSATIALSGAAAFISSSIYEGVREDELPPSARILIRLAELMERARWERSETSVEILKQGNELADKISIIQEREHGEQRQDVLPDSDRAISSARSGSSAGADRPAPASKAAIAPPPQPHKVVHLFPERAQDSTVETMGNRDRGDSHNDGGSDDQRFDQPPSASDSTGGNPNRNFDPVGGIGGLF